MAKEEERRIVVGEIAFASTIDTPNDNLTRSVTGPCRSADGGSRTAEYEDEDECNGWFKTETSRR